ncbi:hypothetical protein LTR53_000582 [Teratosphaeriaceae sp. CCFEE 6253]|nr:hypothetical protein LTR53_000582 [Teratosphaeriaceae sp. CCFEE 6253]
MCPPERPSPDAYDANPQILPHFAPTPPLTDLRSCVATSAGSSQVPTTIRRQCAALYRRYGLTKREHLGLYYAGKKEWLQCPDRERTMVLVLELGKEDIELGRWREIDCGARTILTRLAGMHGLPELDVEVGAVESPLPSVTWATLVAPTTPRSYPAPIQPPPYPALPREDDEVDFGVGETWLLSSEGFDDLPDLVSSSPSTAPMLSVHAPSMPSERGASRPRSLGFGALYQGGPAVAIAADGAASPSALVRSEAIASPIALATIDGNADWEYVRALPAHWTRAGSPEPTTTEPTPRIGRSARQERRDAGVATVPTYAHASRQLPREPVSGVSLPGARSPARVGGGEIAVRPSPAPSSRSPSIALRRLNGGNSKPQPPPPAVRLA